MRLSAVLACLSLAAAFPGTTPAGDACTFDQANELRQLSTIASRHSGGAIDKKDKTVTWHLRDGSTVIVGQGGCADYGSSVMVKFANDRGMSALKAVSKLVAVTGKYLHPAYARDISDAWAHRKSDGPAMEANVILDAESGLGHPLEISLTRTDVSASWQEL